ncbi:MAG: glycosyltransferase, partial [Thaumarchaeota archaeon]|nr:glycosyltransferase [Nitrososphaerota archaeon]
MPFPLTGPSGPLFVAIPGYLLSRFKRIPWVFDVRDLWPDFAVELGYLKSGILLKLASWLELIAYQKAKGVVATTSAIAEAIRGKGVSDDKLTVITNGADL